MAQSSFLEEKRQVTFDWHITQALKWLKFDNGRRLDSVLVYASLELRCAIERYLLELLYLLKDKELTPNDERRCRSKDGILKLMKETEPHYVKRVKFTNLIASLTLGMPKVIIVDIKYLIRMWNTLSEYCHKQLEPELTFDSIGREYQEKGFRIVKELINKFMEWERNGACGIIKKGSMPSEVINVYEKYIKDEINEDQAKRMLELMEPILSKRPR